MKQVRFSVVIPAHNEEKYIGRCLDSIKESSKPYMGQVETIVVLNRCSDGTERIAVSYGAGVTHDNSRNLARIRNAGAKMATGDIIVTIDADSRMSPNMLQEIDKALQTGKYIGGAVRIKLERMSAGIFFSMIMVLPLFVLNGISAGLFWCFRRDFEAIGGFNEELVSVEDVDFAKRLKAYGLKKGKKFKVLFKAYIHTSCRKFDKLGDWFMVKHPGFVWKILQGRSRKESDILYYNAER